LVEYCFFSFISALITLVVLLLPEIFLKIKSSITKTWKENPFRIKWFFIVLIPAEIFMYTQYTERKEKFERIAEHGKTAVIQADYHPELFVNIAHFTFVTDKGKTIESSEKCGSEGAFEKYRNAKVIYNSQNPEEFEMLTLFEGDMPRWNFIFNFIIGGPALAFIISVWTFAILFIFKKIKNR
jgi:hypothetical protein